MLLGAFAMIERRVAEPLFELALFRIRSFTAGSVAGFLVAIARGGLQFMLIIWLQGIWLPVHGYSYSQTPFWAGIFLLPLSAGILIAGPLSGKMSDRFGARGFATAGMIVFGGSFIGLALLPVQFPYWAFALLIAANGIGSGMFVSPNSSSIMNSVPARHRGAASGMRATFQNSGTALSIGVFFSLMIAGLSSTLPTTLTRGLQKQGVSYAVAHHIGTLPPVSSLFASVLGVNPIQHLLETAHALNSLPASAQQRPHRPVVLPGPDRGAVPARPDRRVHRRGGPVRAGRPRLAAARRPLHQPRRRRAVPPARSPQTARRRDPGPGPDPGRRRGRGRCPSADPAPRRRAPRRAPRRRGPRRDSGPRRDAARAEVSGPRRTRP